MTSPTGGPQSAAPTVQDFPSAVKTVAVPPPAKKRKVAVKLPKPNSAVGDPDELPLWLTVASSADGALSEAVVIKPEILSREVSPGEVPTALVTVEIFLPGRSAWKIEHEEKIQATLASLGIPGVRNLVSGNSLEQKLGLD